MKEREKCKKIQPSQTSMRRMVLEMSHLKTQEFEQDGRRHSLVVT